MNVSRAPAELRAARGSTICFNEGRRRRRRYHDFLSSGDAQEPCITKCVGTAITTKLLTIQAMALMLPGWHQLHLIRQSHVVSHMQYVGAVWVLQSQPQVPSRYIYPLLPIYVICIPVAYDKTINSLKGVRQLRTLVVVIEIRSLLTSETSAANPGSPTHL